MKLYWEELMRHIGARAGADGLEDLLRRYAEPQRHYHTAAHLRDLFALLDENADLAQDRPALIAAIFFHDAVYDPASASNEEESAELALRTLAALGAPADFGARVADLIRMTAMHKAPGGDRDAALFLDMDMAILGAPPQDYRAYAANVRREFESVFGPAAYCAGRIQRFIVPVMAAEYIFITPVMRDRYEAQARLNIKAEKADLESVIAGIAGSSKQGTKAQP